MLPSCVLKLASPVLVIPTPGAPCIKHQLFTTLTSLLSRYNQTDNSRILGKFRQSDAVKSLYDETVGTVFLIQLDHGSLYKILWFFCVFRSRPVKNLIFLDK
jgi:hypothetical protein